MRSLLMKLAVPAPQSMHETVTRARVKGAINLRMVNYGMCIACGVDADYCNRSSYAWECDACGAPAVYGIDELQHMMKVRYGEA